MVLMQRVLCSLALCGCAFACDGAKGPAGPEGPLPSLVGEEEEEGAPVRPHVVFLIVDTLRADALGSYGSRTGASPELDFLAREGVRFDQVISQASWTRPSVGSMLTSRYPRALGIHTMEEGALAPEEITLAEVFQAEGYRTVGATANPHLNPVFGFHQGFEEYLPTSTVWGFMENDSGPVETAGANGSLATARGLFGRVLTMLQARPLEERRQPHYLQFDLMDVHEHFPQNQQIRPEFRDLYPELRRQKPKQLYQQAVRQVSRDIGWFLQELRATEGFEDFLLVLVSDHGEGLDSHPDVPASVTHGRLLYESMVRVPWILYHSGSLFTRGRVVQQRVRLLDLMPTLLDILGMEEPPGVQGTSLWSTIRTDRPAPLPQQFLVETYGFDSNKIGLYGAEWKYFENRDMSPGLPEVELQAYGPENGVVTDQAGQHLDLVQRYRSLLLDWEQRNPRAAPFPLWGEDQDHTFEQLKELGYTGR